MKVSNLKSVGAKLFYLMSVLVLITVAGTALQFSITFKKYLTKQVQDTILMQAEKTATQFDSVIENWRTQVVVALPAFLGTTDKELPEQLQRFVNASSEFLAIQLLETPTGSFSGFQEIGQGFTTNTDDQRFEDKEPTKIWSKIQSSNKRWLGKNSGRFKKTKFLVANTSKYTKLPTMITVVRFDVTNSKKVVWAILTTWQSDLIKALPKSQFVDSSVIDDDGKIVTSTNFPDMIASRSMKALALARNAVAATTPTGLESEYVGLDQKRKLGAYARMSKFDLSVIVERDSEQAYQALRENLLASGLWAVLFILISVMFSFLGAAGITKSLRELAYATSRIASGDFNYRIQPKTRDEVGALGISVNNMSRKILQLMHSQIEKARFEKELETAKMVQSTFFPKKDIKTPTMTVTGFYQPASECGGDLWGHFTIEEGVEFLFIADAMGHGAPAALVTAMAFSTCMTVADIFKDGTSGFNDSPSKILERMNRIIHDAVQGTISMTFFAAVVDTNRGLITFSNAGHNFPVLLPMLPNDPRAGTPRPSKAHKVPKNDGPVLLPISLKQRGTPLGMDPNSQYKEDQMEIKAGDKLFFFTDGLIECSSPEGSVWGRKFLVDQIADTGSLDADSMKHEIVGRAFSFFGTKPLDDDVTIAIAEISKEWVPKDVGISTSDIVAEPLQPKAVPDFVMPPPPPPPVLKEATLENQEILENSADFPKFNLYDNPEATLKEVSDQSSLADDQANESAEDFILPLVITPTDAASTEAVSESVGIASIDTTQTVEPTPEIELEISRVEEQESTPPKPASQATGGKYKIKLPSAS